MKSPASTLFSTSVGVCQTVDSSRGMPVWDINVIYFFQKQIIMLHEIYFIKHYYFLKIKFLSDIMVVII